MRAFRLGMERPSDRKESLRAKHAFLVALAAAIVTALSGCGSKAALVKKDPLRSSLASAAGSVKKAVKKPRKDQAVPAPRLAGFPPLPLGEDGPRVRRFVRHYAYKNRETMRRYLARAERYLPMVRRIADEHGLPDEIGYLFMLESGANPDARSPANALGMWQFMPATARSYGLRVDSWVDERLDPEKSTRAAMLYLKDLYGMFGCWRLALSAYNSGENKLNKVLCQEDADEYDEICASPRLKRETREFWPRFQAIAQIARNPVKYGFNELKTTTDELETEVVEIKGAYSLKKLAHISRVPQDMLVALNPALVRGTTPKTGDPYSLRVPRGRERLLAQTLEYTAPDEASGHVLYTVSRGDSVNRILRRFSVNRAELANLNPDVNLRRMLRSGQKLVVPVSRTVRKKPAPKSRRVSLLR